MPVEDVDAATQLETPDTDVEVPQSEDGNSVDVAKPEEPFLAVNDRQVYKTREEALKAYNEAGSRIAELSRWEKQNKQYGINDPQQQAALYDELIALRKEKADAAAQAGKTAQAAPQQELSKEKQEVLKLLKEMSPALAKELGYASKAEIEETLKELNALKEWRTSQEEAKTQDTEQQYQSRLETSETKASQWMKDAGIDDPNGTKLKRLIAPSIKEYINADEERIARWNRGGSQLESVLKEAFDDAIKESGWSGNSAKPGAPSSASRAASVGKQLQSKTLPAQDAAGKTTPQQRKTPIDDTGNRAWEAFKAAQKH